MYLNASININGKIVNNRHLTTPNSCYTVSAFYIHTGWDALGDALGDELENDEVI